MPFEFTSTPSGTGSSGFSAVTGAGNATANLSDIASSLDKINGLMDEAKKQLTSHLLQEEKKASSAPAESAPVDLSPLKTMIQSVLTRLDEMGAHQGQNASSGDGASNPNAAVKQDVAEAVAHVSGLFETQNHNLQIAFNALDSKITDAVNYLCSNLKGTAPAQSGAPAPAAEKPSPVPAPQPKPAPAPTPQPAPQYQAAPVIQNVVNKLSGGISREQLLKIILGSDLCSNGSLGVYRDELLDGFLRGDRASSGLIGAMIEFQSSTPERMPRLLQDIGEAYYRWHPKRGQGADPFERALSHYVCAVCESNGIKNSIELVETGQRFDSGRHNSNSRGVEITEVKGWVVLRDNGKVYTRAAVEVQ